MSTTDPKRLAVLFVIGVIALLFLGGGASRGSLAGRLLRVLKGLACMAAAVICVVLFVVQGQSALRHSIALQQQWDAWPKVTATVTGGFELKGSRSTFRENGTPSEYYPEFDYTVGGELHSYRGIQAPFTTHRPYRLGSTFLLAYDPTLPDQIVAREEIKQAHDLGVLTTVIAIGVALGLFGVGVVFIARAGRTA